MKKVGLTALAFAVTPHLLADIKGDIYLFQINGQTQFPIYGADGGLCTETVSYLVSNDRKKCWGFNPNVDSLDKATADFKAQL